MSKVHKLIVAWYFHVVKIGTGWANFTEVQSIQSICCLSSVSVLVDISRTFLFVKSRVVHKLGVQLESFSGSLRVCAKGGSTIVYCCTVDLCSSPFPGTKGIGGCCRGSDSSFMREELLYLLETRATPTIMKSFCLSGSS
jgi:hypothetical protein